MSVNSLEPISSAAWDVGGAGFCSFRLLGGSGSAPHDMAPTRPRTENIRRLIEWVPGVTESVTLSEESSTKMQKMRRGRGLIPSTRHSRGGALQEPLKRPTLIAPYPESRSSRFRIFPVGPLGNSAMISIVRGYL